MNLSHFAQAFLTMPTTAAPPIAVALVEDDPLFLGAFSAAIQGADDMRLHGTAHNRAEAMALLQRAAADVLVVDLGLPDGPGIDVIRAASRQWPQCLVMVSTVFGDEAHVIQSLEAGAAGYLLKDTSPQRITEEIRTVCAGGSPISPLIARQLLRRFRPTADAPAVTASTAPTGQAASDTAAPESTRLSPREREVLEFITKGFNYEEIGGLMGVSRNTVLSFVRRIYAKLDVRSQIEAIHEARSLGLLDP